MKRITYILTIIYLVILIALLGITAASNHMIFSNGFSNFNYTDNNIYLVESGKGTDVLYNGDYYGQINSVFSTGSMGNGAKIQDICLADSLYVLVCDEFKEHTIVRLALDSTDKLSESKRFVVGDKNTGVALNVYGKKAYITCLEIGNMSASVYEYSLDELVPVTSSQEEEEVASLPSILLYESTSGALENVYYDGTTVASNSQMLESELTNTNNYIPKMKLSIGQSFNVNRFVCMIILIYTIVGILVIILLHNLIKLKRRSIDQIIITEILIIIAISLMIYMTGKAIVSVIWGIIISVANIMIIIYQNRDISVICKDMERISMGNYEIIKPAGNSNETMVLWRGINEMKQVYEKYQYMNASSIAAAMRFIPHGIGAIFGKATLNEIKPGDSSYLDGMMMILNIKKGITNNIVSALERYEASSDGILITGDISSGDCKMVFRGTKNDILKTGLDFNGLILDDEVSTLFFGDEFKFSIAGTTTKSVVSIVSKSLNDMERLSRWFSSIKLRMVITDDVKEKQEINSPLRFIGFIESNGQRVNFYEVLNAYNVKVRTDRINNTEAFEDALNRFYERDFYLARTSFSEILKTDSSDELCRYYLFKCEEYLNETITPGDHFSELTPE